MQAPVTIYEPGPLKPNRPFAWSYSRLKNHRVCPRKHAMVDLLKRAPMDEGPALVDGQKAHDAIAAYLKNGTPLPGHMRDWYPEIRRVIGNDPPGVRWLIEESMAIRRDMIPSGQFDAGVWLRCKVDFAKVGHRGAIAVDWKTGKIVEDAEQLALMAACIFAYYPTVQKIRTQYCWLGQNARTTQDFLRSDMTEFWHAMMPEVERYELAYNTGDFPAKPSGICMRHCTVSTCEYYQRGNRS